VFSNAKIALAKFIR